MRLEPVPSHPPSHTGVGAAFAGAARTSSLDFTLTTADGDRVTLSTSTTDVLGAVSVTEVTRFLAKAAAGHDVEKLATRLSRTDLDSVASVSASAVQSLTVIGGVLAFGPAPDQTPEEALLAA